MRRRQLATDPGIQESHVKPPEFLKREIDQLNVEGFLGDVPGQGDDLVCRQARGEGVKQRLVEIGRDHGRALGHETPHGRGPNATGRAGDQRNFAFE